MASFSWQGTKEIKSIFLDIQKLKKDLHLTPQTFSKMNNLKLLEFRGGKDRDEIFYPRELPNLYNIYFPDEGFGWFANKLRYIHWDVCMSKSLPWGSCGKNLVELKMRWSNLRRLWDGIQVYIRFINVQSMML